MTGREALYGVIGAIAGAAVGYIVTKAMYEKEIDDIYSEMEAEAEGKAEEAMVTYQGKPGTKHLKDVEPDKEDPDVDADRSDEVAIFPSGAKVQVRLQRPDEDLEGVDDTPVYGEIRCADGIDIVFDETHKVWVTADEHVLWSGPIPEREEFTIEQDEVHAASIAEVNDVFIIAGEDIRATNQVVGEFVHETGEVRINKMLTVNFNNLGLDDIIPNDALLPLLGEGAFEELMNSAEDVDVKRLVCVRNNVLNLDFVVSY